jgi:hypothetical protein
MTNDQHDNAITDKDKLRYIQVNHLDKKIDTTRCHFCEDKLKKTDGWYGEEIGEFWSKTMNDTVLAHPDCLPNGIDAVFQQTDPEWSMA